MPESGSPAQTLESYAAAVAAPTPTPGGGSVIANVAALAAGLAEMVCDLTLKRATDHEAHEALTESLQSATNLRRTLLDLAHADEQAYGGYRDAAKLPKSTEAEQHQRETALAAALSASASVPLQIAESCLTLLTTLQPVAVFGTTQTLSDVQTSRRFAFAALENALDMVAANTILMTNRDEASALDRQCTELRAHGMQAHQLVAETLQNRPS